MKQDYMMMMVLALVPVHCCWHVTSNQVCCQCMFMSRFQELQLRVA
jgi:hypothetical protein